MLNGTITTAILRSAITPTTIFDNKGTTLTTLPSDGVVEMHSTDDARVGWVDIALRGEAFESLHWNSMEIGLKLKKSLEFAELLAEESVTRVTIKDETQRLTLQSKGLQLRQSQIVPGYVPQILFPPEFETPAAVVLPGDALDPVITLATDIASHMTLGVDADSEVFYARAEGDDNAVRMVFARDDTIRLQAATVQSYFELDYLSGIQSVVPDDTAVRIALGDMAPAVIQYPFAAGHGVVTFTLKPSV